MTNDDDDLFSEPLVNEEESDSLFRDSILSEQSALVTKPSNVNKQIGKTINTQPSITPSDDSFFRSGPINSRPTSKPASKEPSIALSESLSVLSGDIPQPRRNPTQPGAAPKATPTRPTTAVASQPLSRASSILSQVPSPRTARPPAPGSQARAATPSSYNSDDFADLFGGPSRERSSTSIPPTALPSTDRTSTLLPTPSAESGALQPAVSTSLPSSTPSTGAAPPGPRPSRPSSLTLGTSTPPAGGSTARPSLAGSSVAAPEPCDTPRRIQEPSAGAREAATATGTGTGAGEGRPPRPPAFGILTSRSEDRNRRMKIQCHVPTPFELFRLYDNDNNGRLTREEFFCMMRDMDGHPMHFAPHEDPEYRLVELQEKRKRLQARLSSRSAALEAIEMAAQTSPAVRQDIAAEVADLTRRVAELDEKVATEEAAVRQLTQHPDAAQRVTPEVRQLRAQWRQWVGEEFNRADLGGNSILSIDEFYMYFYSKMCFRFPVLRTGVNPGAVLFNIFVRYCSMGRGGLSGRNEDMLAHQLVRLCRDAGLIDGKKVTRAAVDIVYHWARSTDESLETYVAKAGVAATARMHYPQFLFALDKIAQKRRSGFQEVVARVLAAVEALPEPSFSDFLIMDGNDIGPGEQVPEFLLRPRGLPSNAPTIKSLPGNELMRKMQQESQDVVMLTRGEAPTSSSQGAGLKAFLESKRVPGGKQGSPVADPAASTSPATTSAPAPATDPTDPTSTSDPTSTGPRRSSNIYASLAPLSLNTDTFRSRPWQQPDPPDLTNARQRAVERGASPVDCPTTMHLVRALNPDQLMAALQRVYESYSSWGGGVDRTALDRRRWLKVLRDAGLTSESGSLSVRVAEGVYGKVLPSSSRALNFIQFIEALRHVAIRHRLALNEVMERLVAVGGPQAGA